MIASRLRKPWSSPGNRMYAWGTRRSKSASTMRSASCGGPPCRRGTVLDIDEPPAAIEALPVLAPVAGAPAVVDVDDGIAPAGEELEAGGIAGECRRGRTAVRRDDQWRQLALRRFVAGV